MALFYERTAKYAQWVLDTADIVRDGDFVPTKRPRWPLPPLVLGLCNIAQTLVRRKNYSGDSFSQEKSCPTSHCVLFVNSL